ncbi:MAG: hypothetical protein ACRCXB_13085, partial [Aeromonadaceae bacterium]
IYKANAGAACGWGDSPPQTSPNLPRRLVVDSASPWRYIGGVNQGEDMIYTTEFRSDSCTPKGPSRECLSGSLQDCIDAHSGEYEKVTFSASNMAILAKQGSDDRLVITTKRIA